MKKLFLTAAMVGCLGVATTHAQTKADSTAAGGEPEMDFSQFAGDIEEATGVKRYCTSKIFGISPTKLVSVGYDYQLGYDMTSNKGGNAGTSESTNKVSATHGLRVLANFPVISHNKITVNLGATYMETNYNFENTTTLSSGLTRSLQSSALRSTGVNLTVFKPLNEKNFILLQTSHDLNGDYRLNEWQSLGYLRHSVLGVFGWKKHDRLQFGFGAARTYRVGALNYIPVVLYNYTSENRKWGVEAVFPARAHYRRSFSPRSLLMLGYELEGHTYRLQNRDNVFDSPTVTHKDLELKRSELRLRVIYERSLYDFIWLSVQAGYRYNWRNSYNIDHGDAFRSFFSNDPYVFTNSVTNPLYFNVSINLVSP